MLATEHLEPQASHCKKNNLVSFWRIVSGDLHVWHVTYSFIYLQTKNNKTKFPTFTFSCIYLLKTFSICFCWNLPLIINWLFPSTDPLVPNSASKKSSKCFGWRCNILQISVKLAKDVFFVPIRTTCGGRITNFCFLPAAISGCLSRIISKARFNNSSYV